MTTLKQRADRAFDAVEQELREISNWMHDNPGQEWPSFHAGSFTVGCCGKEPHVGFAPQVGINCPGPLRTGICERLDAASVSLWKGRRHVVIEHGGDAPNKSQVHSLQVANQCGRQEAAPATHTESTSLFRGHCDSNRTRLVVNSDGHPYDNMSSNPVMTSLFAATRAADADPEGARAVGGSSDKGSVSQFVSSIHPMFGSMPEVQ